MTTTAMSVAVTAMTFAQRQKGETMKDRDCENCVHAKPFGGENDNRCDAWECEYIDRQEAIEAYKARREKENQ